MSQSQLFCITSSGVLRVTALGVLRVTALGVLRVTALGVLRVTALGVLCVTVSGVVAVSWYPPGMSDDNGRPVDPHIPLLLDAANKYHLKVCIIY